MSTDSTEFANKYAPSSWGADLYEDLVCPSGQVCLVRVLGMEDLIDLGLTSETDLLTGTASQKIDKARKTLEGHNSKKLTKAQQEKAEADEAKRISEEFANNPESTKKFLGMVARIVKAAVVKPDISMPPEDPADRVRGKVYVDSITLEDKMAIFNFALKGTVKMDTFRAGSSTSVGDVENVTDVQLPSESDS